MAAFHYLILFGPFIFLSFDSHCYIIFDPASFSYKTMLIPAEERAQFNAWSSFCTSGLLLSVQLLLEYFSPRTQHPFVIYCNSLSFLLSTILIYFLPNITLQTKQSEEVANTFVQTLRSDWKQVFHSLELKRTLFSYSFYFKRLCLSLWHLIHKKLFYKTSTVFNRYRIQYAC